MMESEISDSSVIAAYIKRFREQPPASESNRKKMGSKETFWWQSNDHQTHIPKVKYVPEVEENWISATSVDKRLNSELYDLSLSDIRISHSSLGSNNHELREVIPSGDMRFIVDDNNNDDTSVSELADRLVQKCEKLLLGSGLKLDEDSVGDFATVSSSTSTSDGSKISLASSDTFHSITNDNTRVHQGPCLQNNEHSDDNRKTEILSSDVPSFREDDIDADSVQSVGNSSVFYALSPSTSCLSSVQVSSNLIPSTQDHSAEFDHHIQGISEKVAPDTAHSIHIDTSSSRRAFDLCLMDSSNCPQHVSQQQHQQLVNVVDEAVVCDYLGVDSTVSELWQRLCIVRKEAVRIKGLLDRSGV